MIALAYAAFMAGAAAIAIPVVLHFLRRKPTEREAFPSFMFLGASAERAQNRNRLRKWLVLILRSLALLCLALAFAWPYIPAFDNTPDEATVVLWDSSLSMKATPYADEMKGRAFNLIAKAGDRAPMLIGSIQTRRTDWSGKFSADHASLGVWFEEHADGNGSSAFANALHIADARLKEVAAAKRRIVLFTDKQAIPWK